MSMQVYRPAAPLGNFVEMLWLQEGRAANPGNRRETIVPDGSAELVINLSEDAARIFDFDDDCRVVRKFSGAVFSGPHTVPFVIPATDDQCLIGAHFTPGGAFPFLAMPLEEVRNEQVELEALFGSRARELRDRLLSVKIAAQRFAILEDFLLLRLSATDPRRRSDVIPSGRRSILGRSVGHSAGSI